MINRLFHFFITVLLRNTYCYAVRRFPTRVLDLVYLAPHRRTPGKPPVDLRALIRTVGMGLVTEAV